MNGFDLKNTVIKCKSNVLVLVKTLLLHLTTNKKRPVETDLLKRGWKTGIEPATFGTTNRRSNQLSYIHHFTFALQRYYK